MSWLTELCQTRGVKQTTLAQACSVEKSAVSKWGDLTRNGIPEGKFTAVAEALGLLGDELRAIQKNAQAEYQREQGQIKANRPLSRKLESALQAVENESLGALAASVNVFDDFPMVKEDLIEVLALVILKDIREDNGDFIPFFEKLIKNVGAGCLAEQEKAINSAFRALISATTCCYFEPSSFSGQALKGVIDINLRSLDTVDCDDRKELLAGLSLRLFSHQCTTKNEVLEIHFDLDTNTINTTGANLPLPKMCSVDVNEQLLVFCCDLARSIMVEVKAPSPQRVNEKDKEAEKRIAEETTKFRNAIDTAIKSRKLQSRAKHRRKAVGHPLAYSCVGDNSELITKIKEEFPTLPIYQYRQGGLNCLATDLNVMDLAGFAEAQVGLLAELFQQNIEDKKTTLLSQVDDFLSSGEVKGSEYAVWIKARSMLAQSSNEEEYKVSLNNINTLIIKAKEIGMNVLALSTVVTSLIALFC